MLGDIYCVGIDGGKVIVLIEDFVWNIQLVIFLDGSKVVFILDCDGVVNVWVMNVDGIEFR